LLLAQGFGRWFVIVLAGAPIKLVERRLKWNE
jgi:hypothetical protein